jgi:hypothetical protein
MSPSFMQWPKALFVLKKRNSYGEKQSGYSQETTSGLFNSAKFVSDMLNQSGICSNIVEVQDNNAIEKQVVKYRPTHVFIEALWVVPEKIKLLAKLYPAVKWIIRIHSNVPFIANEGNAIDWILSYLAIGAGNVFIAPNTLDFAGSIKALTDDIGKVVYLPNYYGFTPHDSVQTSLPINNEIHVGCFGSIRPLKNQLIQAIAAIIFADIEEKKLVFHINSTRIEQDGSNVLKNIRALFKKSKHLLIEHAWMSHSDFLALLDNIDISMQVSLTETFNIVTADSINAGCPVIVSPDISWVKAKYQATPTDTCNIVEKLVAIYASDKVAMIKKNWLSLQDYNKESKVLWLDYVWK